MRSTRTTSRQRPLARVTGLGPHSAASGAPASTALARRRSPALRAAASALIERRLAGADLAEPRQRLRVHGVRLRLAGGVAELRELLGGGGDRVGRGLQLLRRGQRGELAREAGVPGAQTRGSRRRTAPSSSIAFGRRPDVAGREQRLAPVERELGARRIAGVEAIDRAAEQARRERRRRRARARAGRRPRAAAPRARRALRPASSSGPSSRRCWCACSRCQPIVSSCSGASPTCASIQSARRACSSARVPLSRRR